MYPQRLVTRGALVLVGDSLRSRPFLIVVATSFVALAVHIWALKIARLPSGEAEFYRIDRDKSLSEHFEYAMLICAGCAYGAAAFQRRALVLLFPAVICFCLFLDNSLQLHEQSGAFMVPARPGAGEIIYAVVMVVAVCAAGWWMLQRAATFERQVLASFGIGLVCLGAFAVGVDGVHAVVSRFWPRYDRPLGTIEDFGELLSICLLFALAVRVWRLAAPVADEGVFAE